jgi:amidophosphoribosyltransferase
MPQDQSIRDLVARMKLIPIRELMAGQRMVFCEDSIVRGTQLQDIVQRVFDYGGLEVHMRPACPPLVFGCRFLNFSRSRSVLDLATRKAIREMEGDENTRTPEAYADHRSDKHQEMVARIGKRLRLTSLKYQELPDLVEAIGLPKERLCTFCFDGCEGCA